METEQNITARKQGQLTLSEKAQELLKKEQITREDIDQLPEEERRGFCDYLNDELARASDLEKDRMVEKTASLLGLQGMNDIWEENHAAIIGFIHNTLVNTGAMPTKRDVMRHTGLSRPTIDKHLKEYKKHKVYEEQEENLKMLKNTLMTKLYHSACCGNTGAAKLFLEQMGFATQTRAGKNIIQNQNNYIQINGIRLSQDEVLKLEPEKLMQLEALLKGTEKGDMES